MDSKTIMESLVRKELEALLQRTTEANDGSSTADKVSRAAKKITAIFLNPLPDAESPPFHPARYRLPDERISLTGTLEILPDREHGQGARYYVTTGYYQDGTLGEIFVKQALEGEAVGALLDVVATAVSIGLQYGIPWEVFERKFKHHRFRPNGMTRDEDRDMLMVSSIIDYLAKWVGKRAEFRPPGLRKAIDVEQGGENMERVEAMGGGP